MYDSISIDTTQNVSINLVKASLGDRLLAFIIDVIIKIVYILALVLVAVLIFDTKSLFNGNESEEQFIAVIALLILLYLPVFLYDVLFEILMDGQTPGKKVMKIKVVNLDGESLSMGSCIIRWLFRIIDFMPILYGLVGLISIAVTKNSQRIGDILAKTTVIKTKNLVELRDTVFQMLRDDHQAEFPSVVRLSSRDIEIIKQVLNKPEYKNNADVREKLFLKIKTMLDIETDYDAVTFLKKVLDDYTYYG
jgi:uncharacterized RDD family membrane protein YckC